MYRLRVKACHPDQFGLDPVRQRRGEEELKSINLAFETLLESEHHPAHRAGAQRATSVRERSVRRGGLSGSKRRRPVSPAHGLWGEGRLAGWFLPILLLFLAVWLFRVLRPLR